LRNSIIFRPDIYYMHPESDKYSFNYQPGRTIEELEEERLIEIQKLSYSERFSRMVVLIRLTKKIKYPKLLAAVENGYTG
jgi:predicted DNA-binding protein (UPF0251 family)